MTVDFQEDYRTEFKEKPNEKLEKLVVGFLNSKTGGDIYIGIDNVGMVIGIENSDKTQLEIIDRIKNNILHIGSGINRILRVYDKSRFHLSEHFLEVVFPFDKDYISTTEQVRRLILCLDDKELGLKEILTTLRLKHRPTLVYDYLQPSLDASFIEMTQPESPKSPTQKYRLTKKGKDIKKQLAGLNYE